MLGSQNRVHLPPQQPEEIIQIKSMPDRRIREQIFLRQPEEPHCGIHPPAILRVGRPRMLFLQMHEPARGLDEPFEIVRVLGFRAQPKMLEDVVRLVITLLIPATKEAEVAGMIRNFLPRPIGGLAAQLFDQPGNSLVFVHGKLILVSAEMTGNPARIVFQRRAGVRTAASDG